MPEYRGYAPDQFETPTFAPGRKGLNWHAAKDQLDPEDARFRRNLVQVQQGELRTRDGQTQLLSGLSAVHSASRMNLPATASFMRFWGDGTNWRRGNTSGTLGTLETGFSGDPLTLLAYRPALTGDPWMLAADSNKIRQASATGSSIPLGLPAPAAAVTAAIADILTTGIAAFDTSDGTQAATWTCTAGVDRNDPPNAGGLPVAADVTGLSGNAVAFTTAPGAATVGYSSVIGRAINKDLTTLGGGAVVATDQDLIHLWLRLSRPDYLEEVRVYFVCSSGFDPTVVPGTNASVNTDGFVKAIRPHDITGFLENTISALAAGTIARDNALLDDFLANAGSGLVPGTVEPLGSGSGATAPSQVSGAASLPTQASVQLTPGRETWSEFGNVDRPLRRGEFVRFGSTAGRGWDTITGLVIVVQTSVAQVITLACDDWFLTGGYPLDSTEATATPYDYRVTNYHTITGDESNPSPEMAETAYLDALRQRINVQPVAYGDVNVRQRVYRRGGSLGTDWYYVGVNTTDGALFTDEESDDTAVASATLELDNYQPVPSVNTAGVTILAQPLPVLFGPLEGILFGLGDPNRPGHLYWSKAGRSGSWPPTNNQEVCSPSEELMTGVKLGAQGFLLSREKGYLVTANLVNGQVAVSDAVCQVGICSRWAYALGPKGVYFVSQNADAPGVYVSGGGQAELLSQRVDPIFNGHSVEIAPGETVLPIDWTQASAIRLEIFQHLLCVIYLDTGGTRQMLCLDLLYEDWSTMSFADPPQMLYAEPALDSALVLWQGTPTGAVHQYAGLTDNGTAIAFRLVTGDLDAGRPREDKNLGDVVMDADIPSGVTLTLTTRLNNGVVVNETQPVTGVSGRRRYQFDPFVPIPQRARNVQLDWAGSASSGARAAIYMAGVAYTPLPDQTIKRATTWESFPTEQYVTGISLDIDTNGETIPILVEGMYGGQLQVLASLNVSTPRRARWQASWPVGRVELLRLRPDPSCLWFMLYGYHWNKAAEPPRVAGWDSNWENLSDTYYTGLDLEVDTLGQAKQVEVWVDQTRLTDPATGFSYFTVQASGRRVVHLTFGPGRGHVYRFVAVDSFPGLLYSHRWHVDEEPSEQANWNQNYTVGGTLTDKAVKGVLIEADTFGQAKTVLVELDGSTIATLAVNHNGRLVKHYSWSGVVGRVLRLRPTDAFLSRPYSIQWIFDEEPLQLTRWETQQINHGFAGWQSLYSAFVTLRSTVDVTLIVEVYGQDGTLLTTLAPTILLATGGVKAQRYVQFAANKGVLFRYVFTVAGSVGFSLYREESSVLLLPWGSEAPVTVRPFGSDDLDKVRAMGSASGIAATPNNRPGQPVPANIGLMGGGA